MFTTAKCGHCGKSGTKIEMIEPSGANYKQSAVVCQSCNSILGVTGYYDTGQLLKEQENQLANLKQQVSQMDNLLRQIANALNQR